MYVTWVMGVIFDIWVYVGYMGHICQVGHMCCLGHLGHLGHTCFVSGSLTLSIFTSEVQPHESWVFGYPWLAAQHVGIHPGV